LRVLLTGGCGFIGSHTVRLALERGNLESLVNIDSLTYSGQPMNLLDVEPDSRYSFVHGSINDSALISSIVSDENIDVIIHLAAESHVDRSIGSFSEFVRTNVDGTRVLLEAVSERHNSGKDIHFVHISTDEVYGSLEPNDPPFIETTPLGPMNPYAATKAASDMMVQAFVNTHGISAVITRCSNNYGPNQFPEKLIPLMTLNALAGDSLPVYGDGLQIRDWIHVSDHARGILSAMDGLREEAFPTGEIFNFGANKELSNIEIVETIVKLTGASVDQIEHVRDRPGHDRRYAMGFDKAHSILGWAPVVDWDEGIRSTVNWYSENVEWVESTINGAYREWVDHHYGGS